MFNHNVRQILVNFGHRHNSITAAAIRWLAEFIREAREEAALEAKWRCNVHDTPVRRHRR